ncbi:MAG: PQQ-binding-like beta-propeller repeat protein [Planctomycetota bacterium]|nr:PQQ-binding-like beta-propeller repeat protein [Planctomycetota bacterium]
MQRSYTMIHAGTPVEGFGGIRAVFRLLLAAFCPLPFALAGEVPAAPCGFRGDGSGRYPDATPPIEWDGETKKNILWSVKVGPNPFSSPAVAGGKVFVISKPAQLVCVDAEAGKVLWEKSNTFADLPTPTQEKPARGSAGNVASTPVTDGHYVYVVFGCGIVACYDLQGQRRWIQFFDQPPLSEYGRSASPVLAAGKLLVCLNHLLALDPNTGNVLWHSRKVPEVHGTPLVTKAGGVDVVLSPAGYVARLSDGALLAEMLDMKYTSPIVSGPVVYLASNASAAFELPAQAADKLALKQLWKAEFEGLFYSSAVYDNGLIYVASNEGKFHILDPKSGKSLMTRDLEMPTQGSPPGSPHANVYPSIALAGKYLFLSNDAGDTLVLEPGTEGKVLKHNELPDGSGGTPVFVGKRMYIRGGQNLYCIGEK